MNIRKIGELSALFVGVAILTMLASSCNPPDQDSSGQLEVARDPVIPTPLQDYPLGTDKFILSNHTWLLWPDPKTAESVCIAAVASDQVDDGNDEAPIRENELSALVTACGGDGSVCDTDNDIVGGFIYQVPGQPPTDPYTTNVATLYAQLQSELAQQVKDDCDTKLGIAVTNPAAPQIVTTDAAIDTAWTTFAGPTTSLYTDASQMPDIIAKERRLEEIAIDGAAMADRLNGSFDYYNAPPKYLSWQGTASGLRVDITQWATDPKQTDNSNSPSFSTEGVEVVNGQKLVEKYTIENATYQSLGSQLNFDAFIYDGDANDSSGKPIFQARNVLSKYSFAVERVKDDKTASTGRMYYTGKFTLYLPDSSGNLVQSRLGQMSMSGGDNESDLQKRAANTAKK